MPISFTRYIDITSGVGAGAIVPRRNFGARLFTDNNLLPPQSFIEFTDADQVGAYFGTSSVEYLRAVPYFAWVSKNITRAQKISYARWVQTAVAPKIYGNIQTQLLATYTSITAGSFGITIGGVVLNLSGLDFSGAVSLAGVAAILQTAIQTGTGAMFTSATVTYDASRGSFDFVGGSAVGGSPGIISIQEGVSGTPIANIVGWLTGSTLIIAYGSAVETITQTLTQSAAASNNFGSIIFIPTLALQQIEEAATWNVGQNVKFMYLPPVLSANVTSYFAGLQGFGGTGVTLSEIAGQYAEQFPAMILAATDYDARNSVQNYMFQMFPGTTPGVTTDTVADTMDANRTNYYGRTQDAGQFIDFYQRGVLMGGDTDPLDMNTYANEMWLKDAAGAEIMTLILSLARVSANAKGRSQILASLQTAINQALNNGTISVGKILSTAQKLYITEITGDPNAWQQIQTIGYWVDVVMVAFGDPIQYKAVYTLVYSKDDDIRKVEGQHVLI